MNILMVLTSHDKLGDTGLKTGQNPASSEAVANEMIKLLIQ